MANLTQVLSNKRTIEQQRNKQRQQKIDSLTSYSKRNLNYYDKLAVNQSNKRLVK